MFAGCTIESSQVAGSNCLLNEQQIELYIYNDTSILIVIYLFSLAIKLNGSKKNTASHSPQGEWMTVLIGSFKAGINRNYTY